MIPTKQDLINHKWFNSISELERVFLANAIYNINEHYAHDEEKLRLEEAKIKPAWDIPDEVVIWEKI